MRVLFFILLSLVSTQAHAFTNVKFLGTIGMISLTDRVGGRTVDDDSPRLYAGMNVEPKDTYLGRGKTIKLEDKSFTLLCAIRASGETVCTVVVKAGPGAVISPAQKLITYTALGEQAAAFHSQFYAQEGVFTFATTDGQLNIRSTAQRFYLAYSPSGF